MNLDLSAVILTKDEEANIGRCLERLRWVPSVLVLDSGSTDGTEKIARSFPNVTWAERAFDTHATQWNYGCGKIKSEWVLCLDADYILTEELIREISNLRPGPEVCSYTASFTYCIQGRPLRGTLYPAKPVLMKWAACRFEDEGHTQAPRVGGKGEVLAGKILHDDRKSMERWRANQTAYAAREAKYLNGPEPKEGWSVADRLRRIGWVMPILVPFYTLLVKGVVLDGSAGWEYVRQRTYAEWMMAKEVRKRLR
ncbi:MAG: glycosyltransferase family 2 protein [Verrucomicrobia bacterium]|nr:glycosyltransferase family 2 protein [Verrucomicrobiota bacterium]